MDYPVVIREAMPEDEAIIYKAWLEGFKGSTWLRSFKETVTTSCNGEKYKIADTLSKKAAESKGISSNLYYQEQRKKIDKLLIRSNNIVICDADDPTQVYGFIISEAKDNHIAIHYAYVKVTFRRMGICKKMMNTLVKDRDTTVYYTHPTWATTEVGEKHFGAKFNPWLSE